MKRSILVLACAAVFTTAFSQSDYNPDYSPYWNHRTTLFQAFPVDSDDIVFEGNSITDGGEWCEFFGNANCKNRGISGDTSQGMLDRIDYDLKGHPAKIFIMIGTNDLSRGVSVDSLELNMAKILDRIAELSPETKVYVESVLPVNDCYGLFASHTCNTPKILDINQRYEKMCRERGLAYIDLFSKFADDEQKMSTDYTLDGLHVNGAGYLLWRDAIIEYVNE